jgi:nitrite reductase/ring-hydroxylating ferredoxin subunit
MDDTFIVSSYCIISDTLEHLGHQTHKLAQVKDAEILTVAVVAAKYFHNHQERALCMMIRLGYVRALSVSRYNRRLHALASWLEGMLVLLAELFAKGEAFIIDSLPLPVCKRVRARRCKKVRGKAFCGYCAAKKEKFFGWRLHLVCTFAGIPVSFALVEASHHDLTPVHELCYVLPEGSCVYGDKGYNSADDEVSLFEETGVKLVPTRRKDMKAQNTLSEFFALKRYRKGIETVNSQLESMGIQQLRARSNEGFFIKVHASLLALVFTNLD